MVRGRVRRRCSGHGALRRRYARSRVARSRGDLPACACRARGRVPTAARDGRCSPAGVELRACVHDRCRRQQGLEARMLPGIRRRPRRSSSSSASWRSRSAGGRRSLRAGLHDRLLRREALEARLRRSTREPLRGQRRVRSGVHDRRERPQALEARVPRLAGRDRRFTDARCRVHAAVHVRCRWHQALEGRVPALTPVDDVTLPSWPAPAPSSPPAHPRRPSRPTPCPPRGS